MATGRARPELIVSLNDPSDKGPEPPRFPRGPIARPKLAFSPDGRMLALSRWQRSIPVWEVATGRQRLLLTGHTDSTACVAFSPDSWILASAGEDKTIRLWDLETGKELRKLTGHRGTANSLTFSADGKTLISASDDTTILFWDVADVTRRGRPPVVRLAPGEWETLWAALADNDAARAYSAMVRLIDAPQETVRSLKERLHPVVAADPQRLAQWLHDLDSNEFAVREKASGELEKCGESARPALEQALARPQITLESRRRLEGIVAKLAIPAGERLQRLRAAEVLERIGTPGARQVLETLASGISESRLTQEAKAALRRLPRE